MYTENKDKNGIVGFRRFLSFFFLFYILDRARFGKKKIFYFQYVRNKSCVCVFFLNKLQKKAKKKKQFFIFYKYIFVIARQFAENYIRVIFYF